MESGLRFCASLELIAAVIVADGMKTNRCASALSLLMTKLQNIRKLSSEMFVCDEADKCSKSPITRT